MTSDRGVFSELNTNVTDSVRFLDGSVAEIEGSGTVVFTDKNGEHHVLTEVYYLPRRTENIVSVGQLDESGCRNLIEHNILWIYELIYKLLTHVHRSTSRLYILELKIDRPVPVRQAERQAGVALACTLWDLNFKSLCQLASQGMVRGLPLLNEVAQVWDAWVAGK
jgi:hypothetical protein